MFERVNLEKLEELAAGYRDSAEEVADLKTHYVLCKGDLGKIMDSIMFATAEEEPRLRAILQGLIDAGQLKSFRAFAAESAGKKKARAAVAASEAREAEAAAKELGLRRGGGGTSDLAALSSALALRHASRKSQFDSMLGSLEERYGGKGGGGKGGKGGKGIKKKGGGAKQGRGPAPMEEDPMGDEAFAAAQAKIFSKGKGGR